MTSANVSALAWVFPGQGSQCVGMGKDLAEAFPAVADLYAQADDLLEIPLSKLCFSGPEEVLTQTINAQPALLAASVAVLLALGGSLDKAGRLSLPEALARPQFVAGHSLGEYSALVAAGTLTFPDALRLVRERGRLMGEAKAGSMAAVIGLEEEAVEEVVQAVRQELGEQIPLVIANYNSPGQLVLSGASAALHGAMEQAKARGARRVIPLKVSAAFHSPLMEEAAVGLAEVVSKVEFHQARIPVVANASAQPIAQPEDVREELVTQVCAAVRWTDSLRHMQAQDVHRFLEIGPGKVLAGLIRRTLSGAEATCLGTLEQIQVFLGSEL